MSGVERDPVITRTVTGTCHCQAVAFEVDLIDGFENIRRCNCSICSRKGAVMAGVTLDRLRVVRGADVLSLYQWNTKIAKHWFCSVCGIYTHHRRRSAPNEYGFNLACIEGVDIGAIEDIGRGNGAAQSLVGVPGSYGVALAQRVADGLDAGANLLYTHRDYCGMGLAKEGGAYVYDAVEDGWPPSVSPPRSTTEHRVFTDRAAFVAWLSLQTDDTLSGRDLEDRFLRNNQRLTCARLEAFADAAASGGGAQ